jgi:two-component system response regulator HydG
VVDDESAQLELICGFLKKQGFETIPAESATKALEIFRHESIDLVITDQKMPDMSGLDLLKGVRAINPEVSVIVITAYGTVETAVAAIKSGASDYLVKPIVLDELLYRVEQIKVRRQLLAENRDLREALRTQHRIEGIIGESGRMLEVLSLVRRVAPSDATVLIRGESGTGKELIAKAIHHASPRASAPLIRLNCAALPETLLESELFGHEKGAFTGAIARRAGAFELAHRGTLFLDEIAEMTPITQAKLLRVLQERSFRSLGSNREQSVDIRVIAATNQDPQEAVRQNRLREDLFYRLNVFAIELPPLRDRKDDLPLLAQAFIREFNDRNNKSIAGVSDAAMRALERYHWPGNVREFRNVMERSTIVAKGPFIETNDLPSLSAPVMAASSDGGGATLTPGTTVDEAERRLIEMTLQHTGGNKTRAAELLGISLKTLHNKLNRMKEEKQGLASAPDAADTKDE